MGKPRFSHAPPESPRGPWPPSDAAPVPAAQPTSPGLQLAEAGTNDEPLKRGQAGATVLISETFSSRQGEGKLTGTDSFFIRTSGCNLRCWFCDTPYASWTPTGDKIPIEELVVNAKASGKQHVVLTGGEPLVAPAVMALAKGLMDAGLHLTIETAGSAYRPIPCDLLSLSPKLADSTPDPKQHPRWSQIHEKRRMPLPTMRKLIDTAKETQLKFVVRQHSQFDEVQSIVDDLDFSGNVFIMPQGVSVEEMTAAREWLQPATEAAGYLYCDRMQIHWFGNRRGT